MNLTAATFSDRDAEIFPLPQRTDDRERVAARAAWVVLTPLLLASALVSLALDRFVSKRGDDPFSAPAWGKDNDLWSGAAGEIRRD